MPDNISNKGACNMQKNINRISVEWDVGMETGFASRMEAERFIERVCKKTAPELDFKVNY